MYWGVNEESFCYAECPILPEGKSGSVDLNIPPFLPHYALLWSFGRLAVRMACRPATCRRMGDPHPLFHGMIGTPILIQFQQKV